MELKIVFSQFELKKYPLNYFNTNNDNGIQHIWKQLQSVIKGPNTSAKILFTDGYGNLRTIMVTKFLSEWLINMWDEKGGTSLCSLTQPIIDEETDIISKENLQKLISTSEDFYNGTIECSKCHTKMSFEENRNHRYFAGIYCQSCWDGGMKQKEAAETYN